MNWLRAGVLGLVTSLAGSCNSTSSNPTAQEIKEAIKVPAFSDLESAILTSDQFGTKRHAQEGYDFYGQFSGLINSYSFVNETALGSDWWLQRIQQQISGIKSYPENLSNKDTVARIQAAEEFSQIGEQAKQAGYLDTMQLFVTALENQADMTTGLYRTIVSSVELHRPLPDIRAILFSWSSRREVDEAISFQRQARQGYNGLPTGLRYELQVWFGKYVAAPLVKDEPDFLQIETKAQFRLLGKAAIESVLETAYHRE